MTPTELRQLIEDSARSIGIEPYERGEGECEGDDAPITYPPGLQFWNPTTNKFDCFDLETALGLEVAWFEFAVSFRTDCRDQSCIERFSDHPAPTLNESKSLARMMAATKAAAMLYRNGKDK